VQAVFPVESHPADIIHDGVHILHVLFGGVGVVEAQVAGAVVGVGDPEVQADGFGVADVQVAVGFRGNRVASRPLFLFAFRSVSMMVVMKLDPAVVSFSVILFFPGRSSCLKGLSDPGGRFGIRIPSGFEYVKKDKGCQTD
jgi:hypothetical protein